MSARRIGLLYTGGTLGMVRSAAGYVPDRGLQQALAQHLPAPGTGGLPHWTLIETERLIDSAEALPADWLAIAQTLAKHYDAFDGFVVIHGTDTMAYTASALSFALRGLRKPVILTGAQIPLGEARSDARNHLIGALQLAADHPLPEVMLFFHGRLMRGNRATKVASDELDAFDSPHCAPLARAGIALETGPGQALPLPDAEAFQLVPPARADVAVLRLWPGLQVERLRRFLAPPLGGLVLQSYGAGNGPVSLPGFLELLAQASAGGTVIVNVSQCVRGRISAAYATGTAWAQAGVVGGLDLTLEAAVTKLHHLLALGFDPDLIRQQLPRPWCGECTPTATPA